MHPSRGARILLLLLALVVLGATSACAQNEGSEQPNGDPIFVSTLRTVYFPVLDGQTMIVTVADLGGDTSPGAAIVVRFYDLENELLDEGRGPLFPGEPVSARIDSDSLVFEEGRALVRVEIEASGQDLGAVPASTIERVDIDDLTAEADWKCAGPPMDCGPDFVCQIDCPGAVLTTDFTF